MVILAQLQQQLEVTGLEEQEALEEILRNLGEG